MKRQYVGDISDYRKYALLICWKDYLAFNTNSSCLSRWVMSGFGVTKSPRDLY